MRAVALLGIAVALVILVVMAAASSSAHVQSSLQLGVPAEDDPTSKAGSSKGSSPHDPTGDADRGVHDPDEPPALPPSDPADGEPLVTVTAMDLPTEADPRRELDPTARFWSDTLDRMYAVESALREFIRITGTDAEWAALWGIATGVRGGMNSRSALAQVGAYLAQDPTQTANAVRFRIRIGMDYLASRCPSEVRERWVAFQRANDAAQAASHGSTVDPLPALQASVDPATESAGEDQQGDGPEAEEIDAPEEDDDWRDGVPQHVIDVALEAEQEEADRRAEELREAQEEVETVPFREYPVEPNYEEPLEGGEQRSAGATTVPSDYIPIADVADGLIVPNPQDRSILDLLQAYLADCDEMEDVRQHLPFRFIALGAKVATRKNRQTRVHLHGAQDAYRYLSSSVILGPSGGGKGETRTAFRNILCWVDDDGTPHQLWSWGEHKGGSPESLRGGHRPSGHGGEPILVRGTIEEQDDGYIEIPELTTLLNKRKAEGGQLQEIIGGMDTGDYGFKTVAGGAHRFHSDATFDMDLQISLLDDAEALVAGWNRRLLYDEFQPRTKAQEEARIRRVVKPPNPVLLAQLRAALGNLKVLWDPKAIDWSEVNDWLVAACKRDEITDVFEQLVRSVAIGWYAINTLPKEWVGTVKIKMSPELDAQLRYAIGCRSLAQQDPAQRLYRTAFKVVCDADVLGRHGTTCRRERLCQIIRHRLQIPETAADEAIRALERQPLDLLRCEVKTIGSPTGANPAPADTYDALSLSEKGWKQLARLLPTKREGQK